MGELEWGDLVLTVNGRPIRVLQEVDFGGDESEAAVANRTASIKLPLRIVGKAMNKLAKTMAAVIPAFARLCAGAYPWAPRYRFRSQVEKRHSRTRRKERPTRLQRRKQRQTKNKVKR